MELNGNITAGGALYGAFGTDSGNYNDLRNKPSINGVELIGNKTSEDLHIDPGGTNDYEDLENKPQINYTPLEGNLTLDDLDIQSKIDFPEDPLRFLDGAGQFRIPDYFSGDYDDLANRPEIAGITLTGDKSLTDLGIQEEINFPEDSTKFLNGEGNFTTPAYFSGDYEDLTNKPQIAGETLTGDKSLSDLGIQGEISFPEDPNLYLNGQGNFTQPFSGDYDDITDKPQINGVTLEDNKTASDLKLISEIHTASGAEAAIETDDTLPLISCVSDINPVQDLHGYSKPWAGGAGKNKLEVTAQSTTDNDITYTVNEDGTITATGTATANSTLIVTNNANVGAGSYIINGCPQGGSTSTYRLYYEWNDDGGLHGGLDTGTEQTINNATSIGRIIIQIYPAAGNVNLTFKPMIRLATVQDDSYEPYSNICPISGHTDVTITVASTSGGSGDDTTASLGRTVYKGWVNISTGEGAITGESVDLGTLNYTYDSSVPRFYTTDLVSVIKGVATGDDVMDGKSDIYKAVSIGELYAHTENGTMGESTGKAVSFINNDYTSASDFKTAMSGHQLVYELDTPQNFTLTKEKIITLSGDNYIRSNSGDIEITYVTNVIDPLLKYLLENR